MSDRAYLIDSPSPERALTSELGGLPSPQATHRNLGTLLLTFGNPLRGDDGIGAVVLEQLEGDRPPHHLRILDAGSGALAALFVMQNFNRVVIMVAADFGGNPGDWKRIPFHRVRLKPAWTQGIVSLHAFGLAEALCLGQKLGMLPPWLLLYLVQVRSLACTRRLSSEVIGAIPEICARIREDLCWKKDAAPAL